MQLKTLSDLNTTREQTALTIQDCDSRNSVFTESSGMPSKVEASSLGNLTLKHKNKKPKQNEVPDEPAKSTKKSAGLSLWLQNGAVKILAVKKLFMSQNHNMSSGSLEVGSHNRDDQINHQYVTLSQDSSKDDDVMMKYRNFQKFDIVEDYSDHYYSNSKSARWQPQGGWVKKVQKEWRRLQKGLPDMIFVRVYESRMDLLRAVIVGAEGTPYHNGLFFFDVCFPNDYPQSPPKVHYHSGGLRINPNLYKCGKVCLSLLNTWFGTKKEYWTPGVSTMLQVLVSIQGLILNAKPYFNEPGYERYRGRASGEKSSLLYNERTLILSLKTMVYTMKRPPKNFEDLVIGHFHDHAHGILTTCKAYNTKGTRVGCGIYEGEKTCSRAFKKDVKGYMKTLTGAFKQIGVEDTEEFMSPDQKLTHNQTQQIKACFGV